MSAGRRWACFSRFGSKKLNSGSSWNARAALATVLGRCGFVSGRMSGGEDGIGTAPTVATEARVSPRRRSRDLWDARPMAGEPEFPSTPVGRQAAWYVAHMKANGVGVTEDEVVEHMQLAPPWVPANTIAQFADDDGRPYRISRLVQVSEV